jgi:hypothetical protein
MRSNLHSQADAFCFQIRFVDHETQYSPEAGHILYLKDIILYPIHIQAQKKDIISYHYHGKKGYGYIFISYILSKKIASIVTVSEQQKARPGSTAAHKPSTFYPIKLKP